MSKISAELLNMSVRAMLGAATTHKRNFLETVELQICIKNLDPMKEKRFSGSYRLPNICRPNMKVCIIADDRHADMAQAARIDSISMAELKAFNKQKKLIRKWVAQYDALLVTESLIRMIPRVIGPCLGQIGKFPISVSYHDDLLEKVADVKSTIKFQLKRSMCMAVACGNVGMPFEEVRRHIVISINFLVSLLKKGWQNIKSLHIKSSMGKSYRLF